jgi:hypothetical protein
MGRMESQSAVVVRVACANCGGESDDHWTGFRAYRTDEPGTDDEPTLAFFCLTCVIFEFGR